MDSDLYLLYNIFKNLEQSEDKQGRKRVLNSAQYKPKQELIGLIRYVVKQLPKRIKHAKTRKPDFLLV